MSEDRTVRVFVSSPSGARPERLIAERVVKRPAREFSYHFRMEAVLWERQPLLAAHHFDLAKDVPNSAVCCRLLCMG